MTAIPFKKLKKHNVTVYSKNKQKVYEGKLRTGNYQAPFIELDTLRQNKQYRKNTYFHCTANGYNFTLINCKKHFTGIYPEIVVEGNKRSTKFHKITLQFSNVSEWMKNAFFAVNQDKNQFIIKKQKLDFSVTVDSNEFGKLIIQSKTGFRYRLKRNSDKLVTKQPTYISFHRPDRMLSCDEVIKISHQLRNFFSLLLGFPVGITKAWETPKNNTMYPIYFSTYNFSKKDPDSVQNCLCSSEYIIENDKWGILFQNYFQTKNSNFIKRWDQLSGMLKFSGL